MKQKMKANDVKKLMKERLRGGGLYVAIAVALLTAGVFGRAVSTLRAALPGKTAQTTGAAQSSAPVFQSPTASPTVEASLPGLSAAEASTAPAEQAVFENRTPTFTTAPAETTAAVKKTPTFRLPVNGGVLADYSMGVPVFSATMGDYRTHNGVDLKAEAGAAVHPIAAGTVTAVTEDRLYGNTVTVDHGDGIVSTVCGLANEALIRVGAAVDDDTVLGVVGEIPAEAKEGSHIHLEVRKNGALTDPLALLGLDENED